MEETDNKEGIICVFGDNNPNYFYLENVKNLDNVEYILKEKTGNSYHFITIINKENEKTRNQIYNVELAMYEKYEKYKKYNFKFSIYQVSEEDEINIMIRGKNILFRKENKVGTFYAFGENTEKIPSNEDVLTYGKVNLYEKIEDLNKRFTELEEYTKFQSNMIIELINRSNARKE